MIHYSTKCNKKCVCEIYLFVCEIYFTQIHDAEEGFSLYRVRSV